MLNNSSYGNTVVKVMSLEECEKTPRFKGICPKCKRKHANYYQLVVSGFGNDNHHVYIGDTCFLPTFYGQETHEVIVGTPNVTEEKRPRVSMELEFWCDEVNELYLIELRRRALERGVEYCDFLTDSDYINDRQRCKVIAIKKALETNVNPAFTDLYISLMFLGRKHKKGSCVQDIGIDCSTITEGHISCYSIEALNAVLRYCTEEQLNMFRDVHNGAHIHADCPKLNILSDDEKIAVFNEVSEVIENMSVEDRIKYFGRDFTTYCEAGVVVERRFSHHFAINAYGAHNTVELRLAKIHDADQYTRLVKVWRGCIQAFNDNVDKVLIGRWTPQRLGKRIAREINFELSKYQKGR